MGAEIVRSRFGVDFVCRSLVSVVEVDPLRCLRLSLAVREGVPGVDLWYG